jgi:sortase A
MSGAGPAGLRENGIQRQQMRANTAFRRVSHLCIIGGAGILAVAALLLAHRAVSGDVALAQFDAAVQHTGAGHASAFGGDALASLLLEQPDQSEWSSSAVKHWNASAATEVGRPLAALRIDSLDLRLAVLDRADEASLHRSIGWIEGTARPGEPRNVGIAGHRDSHFRGLRHLKLGDRITLETPGGIIDYEVSALQVVGPEDNYVLALGDSPALTLVTCYPFYFVGSAPERYIVRAEPVAAYDAAD